LAEKENVFREELKTEGVKNDGVNKLGDKFSDEVLEKMEAQKQKKSQKRCSD